MIRVDPRAGSGPYLDRLTALGAPTRHARLDAGDCAFSGYGPHGPERIGVEIKSLSDLLQSLDSGRLTGIQLPRLIDAYDRAYLLVTGPWRPGNDGMLTVPRQGGWVEAGWGRRRWTYASLVRSLTTVEAAGVSWHRVSGTIEGGFFLWSLYDWWTSPWDSHSTGKMFYTPPPPRMAIVRPSLLRLIAAQIPHVGWEYSQAAEDTFESIEEMMGAPAEAWAGLRKDGLTALGRLRPRIGMKKAKEIVCALQGRDR